MAQIPNRRQRRKYSKSVKTSGFVESLGKGESKSRLARIGEKLRASRERGKQIQEYHQNNIEADHINREATTNTNMRKNMMSFYGDEEKAAQAYRENMILKKKK